MDFESSLKSCLKGDGKAPLATVRCSDNFIMRSVIVTRESLWRLCGYGSTSADRYLDDQVRPAETILMFVVNKKKLVQAVNALLGLLVQDQVQFTGAPV